MTATTILYVPEQSQTDRSPRPRTQPDRKTDTRRPRPRDRRAAALQFPGLSGGLLPPRDDSEPLRERRSLLSSVHRARAIALLAMSLDGASLADCERAFRLSRERCRQLQNIAAGLLWKEALLAAQTAPEHNYYSARARREHRAFWHWLIAREFLYEQQRRYGVLHLRSERMLGARRIAVPAVAASASPTDEASQRAARWASESHVNGIGVHDPNENPWVFLRARREDEQQRRQRRRDLAMQARRRAQDLVGIVGK